MTTETEIGDEGCMIQLTSRPEPAWVGAPPTTLLTVRAGKDTDLTESQLRALAAALLHHADYIAKGAGPAGDVVPADQTAEAWRKWFRDSGAAAYWAGVTDIEAELGRHDDDEPGDEEAP